MIKNHFKHKELLSPAKKRKEEVSSLAGVLWEVANSYKYLCLQAKKRSYYNVYIN